MHARCACMTSCVTPANRMRAGDVLAPLAPGPNDTPPAPCAATHRCTTTRFGAEEKARPKACFLWTLQPGAEPAVDQSGSRWVSGRKPVVDAGGSAPPAPQAVDVAAPPSGGVERMHGGERGDCVL